MKGLAIKDVAERTGIAAGDDPHVGAALRVPRARAHRRPATASTPTRTSRRCGASSTFRESGLSVPAALERARAASGATDRPSIYGAIAARRRARPRPAAAQAHAARDLARDRGRDAGPRRRARRVRRLPVGAQLPAVAAPLRAARAARPTPASCSPTSTRVRERPGAPDRGPDLARRTRSATSGRSSSTRPATPPACWRGRRRESQRDDHLPDRDRRFEALWTLDPRIVRRAALVGAALAARAGAEPGARLERGPRATARSPSRRPRRGSPR